MGLRFRKSIKLAPGVRMNISGSGVSWTLGPRGASIGIGKRGTYLNSGIPGTGFYSRERIDGGQQSRPAANAKAVAMAASVGVNDDGTLYFTDAKGNALAEEFINAAKKQHAAAIRQLIQDKCDEINGQIEALGELHLETPSPDLLPGYQPATFVPPAPINLLPKKPGLLGWLFKPVRERIERENLDRYKDYKEKLQHWKADQQAFENAEQARRHVIEHGIYSDVEVMQDYLAENLQSIVWPRETLVTTEILDDGRTLFLDVDLPEIEDMPTKTANAPQRGYKLSVKDMPPTKVQQLYMRHVHGIGFRMIGEAFGALPNARTVILSAYSQRADRATGRVNDEYLYSVKVERSSWARIHFGNLQSLDVVEALSQFELRRNMSKTGVFKAIDPFAPGTMGGNIDK